MGALGYRLTGSSDLYAQGGRKPYASINFVTAHDGFTLNDLVSYNEKHNDANGLSWIDWDLDRDKKDMLEFTRFVIGLTKRHPVLRRW